MLRPVAGRCVTLCLTLCLTLVDEAVDVPGGEAVEVEPPVADEVVLVEESSVGTEEAVLGQTSGSVSSADVESLALSLRVSVVTSVNLAVTGETRLRNLRYQTMKYFQNNEIFL